jgi:hypothetical protein
MSSKFITLNIDLIILFDVLRHHAAKAIKCDIGNMDGNDKPLSVMY